MIEEYNNLQAMPDLTVEERLSLLRKFNDELLEYESKLLGALNEDLRKGDYQGYMAEIFLIRHELKLFLSKLKKWAKPTSVARSSMTLLGRSYIQYEPRGRILLFSTWNYPIQLVLQPLIGMVAAGNSVLVAPSPKAPASAKILKELLQKVFPKEIVQVLTPGHFDLNELLYLDFDLIFYSGSVQFAKQIAKCVADRLIPVILELGGKSPVIITEHANLALAAKRIVWGKLLNSGQTCVAPDYVLIDRSVRAEFVLYLINEFDAQRSEFAMPESGMLPLLDSAMALKMRTFLEEQKILYGGRVDVERAECDPTIVLNPNLQSPLMKEEIFLPILPLVEVESLSEAIHFINDRPSPLAMYIFANRRECRRAAREVRAGGVCTNDVVMQLTNSSLPFGGVGASGMGVYHGKWSFYSFSHPKPVLHADKWINPKFRFAMRGSLSKLRKILRLIE